MGSSRPLLIRLGAVAEGDETFVGGKAANLARLTRAGFKVPRGFCLTTRAYEEFLRQTDIAATIRMEIGRKPMEDMRWEEIWDAALRVRAKFLAQPLPEALRESLAEGLGELDPSASLAVRSSALGEDSGGRSFAGLHESIIGVRDEAGVHDAVRLVWASLWSDAALLYRKELGLDPGRSRMAVLVQEMVESDRSGVAFARDPRDTSADVAIIESVPGACSLLVDGVLDPDRWEMNRTTRGVVAWLPGQRPDPADNDPLLDPDDLETLLETLLSIEQLFRWPPDMEWTGRSDSLTVLQARPITTAVPDEDEQRAWYMTLRPNDARLRELRERVAQTLIPELEAEGQALADEDLAELYDEKLATAIERRSETLERWKKIYWDEFIPFAHGVRRLATYYNDAVQPADPYEFVGLLCGQRLLATDRNQAISELGRMLATNDALLRRVEELLETHSGVLHGDAVSDELMRTGASAAGFVEAFEQLNERFLDVTYDHERLRNQVGPLLRNIVEFARGADSAPSHGAAADDRGLLLERKLLDAVGRDRREEASEMIETGRVSWKLRDDDNLLVARLESQLLRALDVAAARLRARGRLTEEQHPHQADVDTLTRALRQPTTDPITLVTATGSPRKASSVLAPGETPRQLIGQPASPGVGSGLVRRIRGHDDLGAFRRGEILVCDAIQPTMTHLVPLAGAIVERRGGMLIHGAIIARELGIPCVNGVRGAADVLRDGDLVTVDGHLGIVTVGAAEFDLESRAGSTRASASS